MAHDQALAERLRRKLADITHREVKMFGGLSFMVNDNLALSASNQGDLLIRCDPDDVDDLLDKPHVRWAEMRGRRMSRGWLRIDSDGYASDHDLSHWVDVAVSHATRS